jgi:hypothetical protein
MWLVCRIIDPDHFSTSSKKKSGSVTVRVCILWSFVICYAGAADDMAKTPAEEFGLIQKLSCKFR